MTIPLDEVMARMNMTDEDLMKDPEEYRLQFKVKDPDAMVAWIRDNLKLETVQQVLCHEEGERGTYLADIIVTDASQATLLKTFWAS